MHPKQMRRIATNPKAYMDFVTTGRPPRLAQQSDCPLLALLTAIPAGYLSRIVGITVDQSLGYTGRRTFHNAAQALHWIRPSEVMLESEFNPAESWRDKRFAKPLYIEDLLEKCTSYPETLLGACGRLRRPAPRTQAHEAAATGTEVEARAERPRG